METPKNSTVDEIQIELDVQKYSKYYNMFFGSGIASLAALFALFFYIGNKRYQRFNPIGIMFNQIVVQIALSFRLDYDFISSQIDGTNQADFYCSFEGLYYYAFHFLAVYFTSFGFSIVVYFQDQGNFTSAANLMCFVVDDNSMGYYLLFNVPILLYVVMFFYTYCRFGRPIVKRQEAALKASNGDQESLLQKEETIGGLSPHLHLKLYHNINLQVLYFVLWFLSIIPNFLILDPTGLKWYSLFSCIHPIVIFAVVMRALAIGAQNLERQGVISQKEKKDNQNQSNGTEMSDYSSLSDISFSSTAPPQFNTQYRQVPQEEFNQYADINPKIVTKEQIENFRIIIRENILESIVCGFQAIQDRPKPKYLYDKQLGYGEAPIDTHMGLETQMEKKEKVTGIRYIIKHIKEFFAFNRQGAGAQISPKDPNAEALVIEGQVLGHPEIIKRFNVTMKSDELNKCSKTEKVTQAINTVEDFKYDFIELAPEVFHVIRKINNIDETLIKKIFSLDNIHNLKVDVSQTKGGMFYIFPLDGGIILKSISKASYKQLQEFIPDYYKHTLMNPNTKISPILGVYSMKLNRNNESMTIHFILQRSIQDFYYDSLATDDISFGFDIKGQVQGRKHLDNPRDILNFSMVLMDKEKYKYKLKDQDFLQSFKKLDITQYQSEKIVAQLESDVELLTRHFFMDYSLYLVVVIKPFREVDFLKQQIHGLDKLQISSKEDSKLAKKYRKHLYIGESDSNLYKKKGEGNLILVKERTQLRSKAYHVCDSYDIVSVKQYEHDTLNSESTKHSRQDIQEQLQSQIGQTQGFRSNSIINFISTGLSYEFSQTKISDDQRSVRNSQIAKKKADSELKLKEELEKSKKPNDLLQQLNMFYNDDSTKKEEQKLSTHNNHLVTIKHEEKPVICYECKQNKMNHFVSECINNDLEEEEDQIKNSILKFSKRDVIEQFIFDPQLGIVKREIHYGIIDYLTTYQMKKRYDEINGIFHQANTVRPTIYGERFVKTMKKIFQ
ncbi:phosphatidylinositol-4-phosphate 5-kinase [Stylonychia lemnae]|uniref:Phosphatidylinositol-4-phosphate 5-kinase n=1 Tax=Stylonychia lemnae TaxID=5949 RepID=A0A077ZXB4_STYLE|nr:phosphatidylinositol-4-phosphate 5-kinase [Stylonychia lemnae]|eukprot:CDW74551.1 phosphatidylinositol-4-phosphate 5-kinase [Stylonychia lemnae]